MKKAIKLKMYSDPSHGWLAVKESVLFDLGIHDKISAFSYRKGLTVYLEEDCDAPLLMRALGISGIPVDISESHSDKTSPIRSYRPFKSYTVI